MQGRILPIRCQIRPNGIPGAEGGWFYAKIEYFCKGMKKIPIIVAYWIVAMFVTALILVSLDYEMGQALMMSLTFLPSAMALAFFLPKVDRTKDRVHRILDTIYIVLGVMTMTFFLIFIIQTMFMYALDPYLSRQWDIPAMLRNPVFIACVLAVLAYGNYLLGKYLDAKYPSDKPITFTSDYRKVLLKKEDILYVESRDSEVWIVARDGRNYRNRTGITQWENLLGPGFVRIHRAFLVNVSDATLSSPDTVTVGGKELPVSRKYKDAARMLRAE